MKKRKLKNILFMVPLFISNVTQNNSYQNKIENNNAQFYSCPILNENNVKVIDGERSFNNNFEYFDFLSNFDVDEVTYEGNVKLSSYSISGNNIRCLITDINDLDEIILSFIQDGEVIDRQALYFAKSSKGVYYSSNFAIDDAMVAAGQSLNYFSSYEDKNNFQNDIPMINPTSIGVDGSVSGTLKWTDEQGNAHPLAEAKVKVTISGSWWSSETYTDDSGYYYIEYKNIWYVGSGKPTVHIYAENQNVKVYDENTYMYQHEFNGSSGDWTFDYTFSPINDDYCGKAMMIFQGAKNFADYAKHLNGENSIDFYNFHYPSRSEKYPFTYYDGNGTVEIYEEISNSKSLPQPYSSWDVIGHEYGHHVQEIFKISDGPTGVHSIGTNNIDYQIEENKETTIVAKDKGQRLSWEEGWASYWSITAQSYFSDDLKTINTVGDTCYTSSNSVDVDLNVYDSSSKGDASELAIQRILYKLYNDKTDSFDKFALGDLKLWNIINKSKPIIFSDFINSLYDEGYDKNNIALLLGKYNVISNIIRVSDDSLTYTWSTYMGSKNIKFNKFDLYFEDLNGNILVKKSNIITSGDSCEITLSKNDLGLIKNNISSRYAFYYVAWQTDGNLSGGYYSKRIMRYI